MSEGVSLELGDGAVLAASPSHVARCRVSVIGLGYIGLPTAALLAEAGHDVIGCDTRPETVALVNEGRAAFREPDLDALLARAWTAGRLRAAAAPQPAAFHLIAVPTPFAAGHRPDLSHVEAAADSLAPVLRPGDTVILESTVPVGTTERLAARLASARPDLALPRRGLPTAPGAVHVAHCPERVMPGRTLRELVRNDRVIGGLGEGCARRAAELYRGVVRGELVLADCRMAELVKLAENAFRDVNIAFANELAGICGQFGLDVWQAIALANRHPRVEVLRPGAGVGGHCIAVDPWFLVDGAPERTPLIRAARAVNDATPRRIAAQVREAAGRFAAPRIACLGLAYKPDVEDLRESPALSVAAELAQAGLRVTVCDPFVAELPPALAGATLREAAAAVAEADIVAILVPHTPFRALDPALFRGKAVVDAVGLLAG
jgi:UDP-N-acetyl-D-mannosaminuronic acid dehydrogenase